MTSGNLALPVWLPIDQAPKDNKRPLYIAQFNESGELIEMDWNASWEAENESWEIPQVYYVWMSANGRVEEPTHFAYMDYQPSPGGQGDALAMEMACSEMHAVVQRAGGYRNGLLTEMLEKGMAALAARQPVGQEAVAFQQRTRFWNGGEWSDWKPFDARHGFPEQVSVLEQRHYAQYRPLYAAPPAQSVDLGQFRPFVEAQRNEYISHGLTSENACVTDCDELLALIDSQGKNQ